MAKIEEWLARIDRPRDEVIPMIKSHSSFGIKPASQLRDSILLKDGFRPDSNTNLRALRSSHTKLGMPLLDQIRSPDFLQSTFDSHQKMQAVGEARDKSLALQNELIQQYNRDKGVTPGRAITTSPSIDTLPLQPVEEMTRVVSIAQLGVPQRYIRDIETLTPNKQSAKKLEGTFLPVEVKFNDMKQFEKSARKNMISKYPSIPSEQFK